MLSLVFGLDESLLIFLSKCAMDEGQCNPDLIQPCVRVLLPLSMCHITSARVAESITSRHAGFGFNFFWGGGGGVGTQRFIN